MEASIFEIDFESMPLVSPGKLKNAKFLAVGGAHTILGSSGRFKINKAMTTEEDQMAVLHLARSGVKPNWVELEAEAVVVTLGIPLLEGEFQYTTLAGYLEIENAEDLTPTMIPAEPDFEGIFMEPPGYPNHQILIQTSIQQPSQITG